MLARTGRTSSRSIYAHVYFPVYSNGLKDVAGYLGFSWTEPDASGLQSLVWRAVGADRRGVAKQRLMRTTRRTAPP